MQFDEMGNPSGKALMLLPGTACDYQTNFAAVLDRLGEKYHLICVNYDGFDGSGTIFPDMITVTESTSTMAFSAARIWTRAESSAPGCSRSSLCRC